MPVLVVVTNSDEVGPMVRWAAHFARARADDIVVLHPVQRDGPAEVVDIVIDKPSHDDPIVQAVIDTAANMPVPAVTMQKLMHSDPRDASQVVMQQIAAHGASLLVIAKHEKLDEDHAEESLIRRLFRRAPCDTLFIRPGNTTGEACQRILIPTGGGPNAAVALRVCASIAEQNEGSVDALFVEPRIGNDAELIGRKILDRAIGRALEDHRERVNMCVSLANQVSEGIHAAARNADYDLLLVGASNHGAVRRTLFGTIPDKLLNDPKGTAVAVFRRAIPLTTRVQFGIDRLFRSTVPQLERDDRLSLVERVQSNSQWNFDFITLVCLSTTIAALGLLRDAASVVIGAMLVAPLMTPLVGGGLALVQGNWVLVRNAAKAVAFGFMLAYAIGVVLGLVNPTDEITHEMASRGEPNVIDLGVAFISGIAAAYATARPNLWAALPGVAIAAALVPPIATSGLALAMGETLVSAGALLLFGTNIIAIVLGAMCALYAVGIRGGHVHGKDKPWVRRTTLSLIVVTAMLAVPLSYVLYASLPRDDIPAAMAERFDARVAAHEGATVTSIRRVHRAEPVELLVDVASPAPLPSAMADDLAAIARESYGSSARVRVIQHLVIQGDAP